MYDMVCAGGFLSLFNLPSPPALHKLHNQTTQLQVSWIRHRDIHILTVGSYTYTSDQRFQATHDKETGDWTLQIKWVQKRDKGAYECQVSTQPVMSYFVHLDVVGKQPTETIGSEFE